MAWRDSATPLELIEVWGGSLPVTVQVEAGTGNVQLQLLRSDGVTWYTPAGTDWTFDADGAWRIERNQSPRLQIIATGNAKFQVTGA